MSTLVPDPNVVNESGDFFRGGRSPHFFRIWGISNNLGHRYGMDDTIFTL